MTYPASTISYWVGQANDTSGGTHPPGWSNGQRWSETATEWMNDRDAWYGNAVDTSGGAHPPGWAYGQLWSETATEWMNDRNAWYNQAQAWYTSRYNDGYSAGDAAVRAALGANPTAPTVALSGANLGGGWGTRGTVTLTKTGYWLIYAICALSTGNHMSIRLVESGTVRRTLGNIGGTVGGSPDFGGQATFEIWYGAAVIAGGTQFHCQTDHTNGFDTINSGASGMWALFIPTQNYL